MSHLPRPHTQRQLLWIGIGLLAFLFGLWFYHNAKAAILKREILQSATLLDQPRQITPFFLTNHKGNPFTLQSLKGHWNLVFFGFTNCPDLCPTTLSTLNHAYQKMAALNPKKMPQVLFISVDPEKDHLEKITNYLASFNPQFIGATGDLKQLDRLTEELGILYAKTFKPDATSAEDYSIDHSGAILIINPQGQFSGVFNLPHDANKIAHDMNWIMQTHE